MSQQDRLFSADQHPTSQLDELLRETPGVPGGQNDGTRPRSRSPWGKRLGIIFGVLLGLLLLAAILGEMILRQLVPNAVEDAVREQLALSSDHEVTVTLGGTSVLAQALTGSFRDIELTVPDAPLGELRGDISATVRQMPIAFTSAPIGGGQVRATFTPEQLQPLLDAATAGLAGEVSLENGEAQITSTFSLFGASVPLRLSASLGAADGKLLITPTQASAGGFEVTKDSIATGPAEFLAPLLETTSVCLAEQYPAGLLLTDFAISSRGLATATMDVAPTIVTDPAMREPGTC